MKRKDQSGQFRRAISVLRSAHEAEFSLQKLTATKEEIERLKIQNEIVAAAAKMVYAKTSRILLLVASLCGLLATIAPEPAILFASLILLIISVAATSSPIWRAGTTAKINRRNLEEINESQKKEMKEMMSRGGLVAAKCREAIEKNRTIEDVVYGEYTLIKMALLLKIEEEEAIGGHIAI